MPWVFLTMILGAGAALAIMRKMRSMSSAAATGTANVMGLRTDAISVNPTLKTIGIDLNLIPRPGVFVSSSGVRGIRNHNPGNIRKSSDPWLGLADVQDDPSFFKFVAPQYGVRALGKILLNYERKYGLKTVSGLINRWAPPAENNTSAYVNAVSKDLGVSPTQTIDVYKSLPALAKSIILHENGSQPYKSSDVDSWVYLS